MSADWADDHGKVYVPTANLDPTLGPSDVPPDYWAPDLTAQEEERYDARMQRDAHHRYLELDRKVSRKIATDAELSEFGWLLVCNQGAHDRYRQVWRQHINSGAGHDAGSIAAARLYNGTQTAVDGAT